MLFTTILVALIAFLAAAVPGTLFALALLKRTGLNLFEIGVIGFIFGLMGPAGLTWAESYLMSYIHFFSFSLTLFLVNTLLLTIVGAILCLWQGVFQNFKEEFLTRKEAGAPGTTTAHARKAHLWVWILLFAIMISVFATRMLSVGITPNFFEFDPYFDMIDANYVLTFGQQLLLDPSAWPSVPGGTNHRIEPLVPYLEAFWYDLSNHIGVHSTTLNTTLMSLVGGVYPPIAAALLVFAVFMLIYHEYNEYIALIGAGLTASMPVLFTTFISGEQLVEPWGIFALFFFLAAYMLATKNPKSKRLAIFAGIAFISNFIGAHYYTVTVGVFVIYMLLQGTVDILRGDINRDFYKMNGIIIAVVAVFLAVYLPYSSTLQNRVPSVLGIPITISGPVLALILVAFMDFVPKLLVQRKILFKEMNFKTRLWSVIAVAILALIVIAATPLGAPIENYLTLSTKFTTPSSALFMTVEEYVPTGFLYDFGSQGIGVIGASIGGAPVLVWIFCGLGVALLVISAIYRKSRTGILYLAMALPLMFAGFSEVKYLPHFGVAFIMLFCVILGEGIYLAEHNFNLRPGKAEETEIKAEEQSAAIEHDSGKHHANAYMTPLILAFGLFFVSSILAIIYLAYVALTEQFKDKNTYIWGLLGVFVVVVILVTVVTHSVLYGESSSYLDALGSAYVASTSVSASAACTTIADNGASIGYTVYCNTIPQYWLDAMAWINQNVGPNGTRVLAWWDYGDWINWFGNSNAVLRGDNANATEDYATAAHYVLGEKFGPSSLASFMNGNQSSYVLFDQDLISKWQALDFLGCIYTNETSYKFAIAQGAAQNPPVPFALGNSQCELQHDPEFALIPLAALIGNESALGSNINFYCSFSNSSAQYITTLLVLGNGLANQTACTNIVPNKQGVLQLYNSSGTKMNAVLQSTQYQGVVSVQGTQFVEYMVIYLPTNSINGTISDAPSLFYSSNYYRGFILGNLPGFTEVYPANATAGDINYVNGTYPIRIYKLDNFTGQYPPVPPKPSWIHNNYTMP